MKYYHEKVTYRLPVRYDIGMKNGGAKVSSIIIGPEAEKVLREVAEAVAVPGRGLEGDRYYRGCGSFNAPQFDQRVREVTLIDAAAIAECNRVLGTSLQAVDFRRNIVTEGLDLSRLKGKRFRIGPAVVLKFARTAPPCRYLARLLGEDVMRGLKGIGGIRALIERGGTIRMGDDIDVLP